MYMITGIIIIIDLISWINSFGLVLHPLIGAGINIVELAIYNIIYNIMLYYTTIIYYSATKLFII